MKRLVLIALLLTGCGRDAGWWAQKLWNIGQCVGGAVTDAGSGSSGGSSDGSSDAGAMDAAP